MHLYEKLNGTHNFMLTGYQCCGSESGSESERIRAFLAGTESESESKILVPDLDSDSDPDPVPDPVI
jgi:hypothetical protein